jgi:hypothetical protein
MKSASDFVALLRLILYDILGLVIPGAVFLFLIIEYSAQSKAASELTMQLRTHTEQEILVTLLVAYLLGYLLQAISYRVFLFFMPFGQKLLRKPTVATSEVGAGVSAANMLTRNYFVETEFFKIAKRQIAETVGVSDSAKLTYGDVMNLAFSLARDEADQARQFRFRSDLCGAVATLVLLHFIGLFFFLGLHKDWRAIWCLVPAIILLWMYSLGVRTQGKYADQFRWLIPTLIALGLGALLLFGVAMPQVIWSVPLLVPVWFFFLYRSFFYGDIGGRIIFYMALAACRSPQGKGTNAPIV